MNEFELIQHFFAKQINRTDVTLGIGDDAALVIPPAGHHLAVTTDTLVSGVHFPLDTSAFDIGFKALAVNLSDLAAMGAEPAWVTMALTLPHSDPDWLREFCDGFFELASAHKVQLIGGDLTRGPLSITIQAMGFVPVGKALTRSSARVGDLVYVTGTLGDAGLGLAVRREKRLDAANKPGEVVVKAADINEAADTSGEAATIAVPEGVLIDTEALSLSKLNRPEPRVAIGIMLRDVAHAAIDISDGLAADLGHILSMSKVGARLNVDALPFSKALKKLPIESAIALALTAGDDYELCFTIPSNQREKLEKNWHYTDLNNRPILLTCIGEIIREPRLHLQYQDNTPYKGKITGYEHF